MVLGKRHFPFLKRGDAATSCETSRRSIYALLDPLRGSFNVENTASCRCASDRSRCPVIYDEFTDFARAVANMAPLAGLDLGTVTIGVAVSDTFQSVATPLETIKRKKFGVDAEKLFALLKSREIGGLVLGLPRNMDGSEGPRCQSTRAFARNLSQLTDLPIGFWDERLSTVAAERALLEADTSRKRRSEVIDHVAASFILQGALDRIGHLRRSGD